MKRTTLNKVQIILKKLTPMLLRAHSSNEVSKRMLIKIELKTVDVIIIKGSIVPKNVIVIFVYVNIGMSLLYKAFTIP